MYILTDRTQVLSFCFIPGMQDTIVLDASSSTDPYTDSGELLFTWTCYTEGNILPEQLEEVMALPGGGYRLFPLWVVVRGHIYLYWKWVGRPGVLVSGAFL